MTVRLPSQKQVALCVALAFLFWGAVFGLRVVNFWLGLSVAACILVALSFRFAGVPLQTSELTVRNAVLGLASAVVLYGIFALCHWLSGLIFSFAPSQVAGIYQIRQQAPPVFIVFVLVFITSPAEELFWRGFLQRWAMERFGQVRGWLVASGFYAGVHVASGNFMLTGAALVAGLFWGYVYMRTQSLVVCILSHAVWTVAIFVLWPLG